jgi:hypothetical protein
MFKRAFLALVLAAACDPYTDPTPQERKGWVGVNGEVESMEYVGKMLGSCIEGRQPVTMNLYTEPPMASGLQSYYLWLESTATEVELSCLSDLIEAAIP